MKKQQEKRLILQEMSERDIRYIGQTRYFKKHYWQTFLWIAVGLAITFIVNDMLPPINANGGWIQAIYIIVMYFIIVIPILYKYGKAGKKFWDSIKDKEQPVKI